MGVSVKVLNCDGYCKSCYENRIRQKKTFYPYDIEAIEKTLKEEINKDIDGNHNVPTLHGGEPLLMAVNDMERLLKIIFEKYGRTSIQTNALSMNDKHLALFKTYKTSVGISIDGDTAELNRGRWNAKIFSDEYIQKQTDKVMENIKRCKDAGLSVSVISILRKYNASPERINKFLNFLRRLRDEFGIFWVRANEGIVYDENQKDEEELTSEELGLAFTVLASICLSDKRLMWSPFRDIVDSMLGNKNVVCIFTECDVWHTTAEEPIDYLGNIGNCLKGGGAVDGLQVLRADSISKERYEALIQIPQEYGGCKDCRYWCVCKAGCPGEGMNNDWRSKTRFCYGWKQLFTFTENYLKGIFPNVNLVMDGAVNSQEAVKNIMNGSSYQTCSRKQSYVDKHGDAPHGDHYDSARRV